MNLSYLYLAFIKRDVPRVASGLRLIMVLEVVIGNVKEVRHVAHKEECCMERPEEILS